MTKAVLPARYPMTWTSRPAEAPSRAAPVALGRRWPGWLLGLLTVGAAAFALLRAGFELHPRHTARPSAAQLDSALAAAIDAQADADAPRDAEAAIETALDLTGEHLHFGMRHPMDLRFGVREREAHCVEYAHLFARVLERVARRRGLALRAWVVHSARARVLGREIPWRGWGDHDWVLVQAAGPGGKQRRFYVDPTLEDAGLGWDVQGAVRGQIRVR